MEYSEQKTLNLVDVEGLKSLCCTVQDRQPGVFDYGSVQGGLRGCVQETILAVGGADFREKLCLYLR